MRSFDLAVLFFPTLTIFFLTLMVSWRLLRSVEGAIFAAFIKSGLFFVYYGNIFDGTYTFKDDLSYLSGASNLLDNGIGITNINDNWDFLFAIGGGEHFIYYLHNVYSFKLFGEGYYAPVAVNVIITLIIALLGVSLAKKEFGFSFAKARLFSLFLLFHPDILVWSNVMNGKDILVLSLHIALLMSASIYFNREYKKAAIIAIPSIIVLLFLRFYVPLLIIGSLAITFVIISSHKNRTNLIFKAILTILIPLIWLGDDIYYYGYMISEYYVNPVYGFVRVLLTPVPFKTEASYAFLDIPSLLNWIFFPFLLYGALLVFRKHTPFSIFLLVYIFSFVFLYSIFGELQGPRHRVQLDYAIALFQFMGIYKALSKRSQSLPSLPTSLVSH
jgi:hypothetical protein